MNITGNKLQIGSRKEKVYEFLSNFNNFEKLMPEQVSNWTSDSESCTFTVQGMTTITLKYSRKEPFSLLEVVPEGKSPISFSMQFRLEDDPGNEQFSLGLVFIDANMNPMIAMVAKRPLENLVNVMGEKLKEIFG
jgi:carbon monoxide dehydrogenase subunit G